MKSRIDEYEALEEIGRGAFGTAVLVLHKKEEKKYVMKKIPLARQTENCRRTAHQEMELISRLKNPYIVEYKEAWVEKGVCICIVTSYCDGGDMAEMIKKARGNLFPEEKLCKWLSQLLLAVDYLHSNHVLHRDLKCSNIFLTKEHDIRLGDFGLAKSLVADRLTSSVVGTPNYMCPELLADIPYGFKSDIWSLGCCLFEMAAHQSPFKASDMAGLLSKINRSTIAPFPNIYSSSLKKLIKSMLRKNPDQRPTAGELLRHPHLQSHVSKYCCPLPPSLPKTKNTSSLRRRLAGSSIGSCSSTGSDRASGHCVSEELDLNDDASSHMVRIHRQSKTETSTDSAALRIPSPHLGKEAGADGSILSQAKKLNTEQPPERTATADVKRTRKHGYDESFRENSLRSLHSDEMYIKLEEQSKDTAKGDILPTMSIIHISEGEEEAKAEKEEEGTKSSGTDESFYQQKADALEYLLELCAELLEQERLEELAGILRPFGPGVASPRETAIWLTKSIRNT